MQLSPDGYGFGFLFTLTRQRKPHFGVSVSAEASFVHFAYPNDRQECTRDYIRYLFLYDLFILFINDLFHLIFEGRGGGV